LATCHGCGLYRVWAVLAAHVVIGARKNTAAAASSW
jgi:hypothetical protein